MMRPAIINVMDKAARKAGRALNRDFGEVEQLQVSRKGAADFVSSADLKAERTLREELQHARPDFGFLGEEGGESGKAGATSRWIVDPLDGTTNFLHGLPHFSISIAQESKGDIVAGIVYVPLTDQLYWAERNTGAYLNDRRIRVSVRSRLADSVIATGIPFKGIGDHPAYLKTLEPVMAQVAGIRRFGVASLDLAYVAAGRFDGFWEFGLKSWDIAAGIILVREAGGFVTDLSGGATMMETGDILATNSELQSELLKILRDAQG